jgi:hypothetical protein
MKNKTQDIKKENPTTMHHSEKQKSNPHITQEIKPANTSSFINKRYSFNGNANGYRGL